MSETPYLFVVEVFKGKGGANFEGVFETPIEAFTVLKHALNNTPLDSFKKIEVRPAIVEDRNRICETIIGP